MSKSSLTLLYACGHTVRTEGISMLFAASASLEAGLTVCDDCVYSAVKDTPQALVSWLGEHRATNSVLQRFGSESWTKSMIRRIFTQEPKLALETLRSVVPWVSTLSLVVYLVAFPEMASLLTDESINERVRCDALARLLKYYPERAPLYAALCSGRLLDEAKRSLECA